MDFLRTPEVRFANLAEYPFTPHYIDVEGLRIHYVDEGARDADPVLLLHGEPTWSYLYRRTIPLLTAAGHRVVAPDLVGFGRSDKPTERSSYSYKGHVDWMRGLLTGLDLRNVTVVGHDWGGLIGLRLAAEDPERFARIVAAQTALPTGDLPATEGFLQWQRFSQEVPVFSAGDIVQMATATDVPAEIRAGYDAPFPDERYQAGAREFPMLVPISPDNPASRDNRVAWHVLRSWDKPFLTVFSGTDQSFAGAAEMFQDAVPGAKHQQHRTVDNTGHFVPEDLGEELGKIIVAFVSGG
jgi:haloalkane dehalogenase